MVEFDGFAAGVPSWTDLSTDDPQGAMRFYKALFGWELDEGPAKAGGYTTCRVRGRPVAAINGQPVTHIPAQWVTYIATDNAQETARRITEAGGTVHMGPLEVMDQGSLVVATDPAGVLFGAWQEDAHHGFGIANEPGAVAWNELVVPDLAGAVDFYTRVFGWTWEVVDTGYHGPPYQTFSADGLAVGGAVQGSGDPTGWLVHFAVADADAAVAEVTRLGGTVSGSLDDTPLGRMASARDPQQAAFRLVELPG